MASPLAVGCPQCGAAPGWSCIIKAGDWRLGYHAARKRLAKGAAPEPQGEHDG